MPNFAWLDETIEHSDADFTRATALAAKWSQLQSRQEYRYFTLSDDDLCDPCEAKQAELDLDLELVEDKLAAIGARMMRPYEHFNEEERYMEYMETRGDYDY